MSEYECYVTIENMEQMEQMEQLEHLDECFICFERDLDHNCLIKLVCCQNTIHYLCLFNVFLNFSYDPYTEIKCPICRNQISIVTYFDMKQALKLFSDFDENIRIKHLDIMDNILYYNYIKYLNNKELSINRTTAQVTIVSSYITYFAIFFVFIFWTLCIIFLFNLYDYIFVF